MFGITPKYCSSFLFTDPEPDPEPPMDSPKGEISLWELELEPPSFKLFDFFKFIDFLFGERFPSVLPCNVRVPKLALLTPQESSESV